MTLETCSSNHSKEALLLYYGVAKGGGGWLAQCYSTEHLYTVYTCESILTLYTLYCLTLPYQSGAQLVSQSFVC